MKIFKDKYKLKKEILGNKNISFVPTMGGLHEGHSVLIKKSKRLKGKTLVSIFINPKQFNDKKDFINYPKNFKKDLKILKRLNVNYVFIPKIKDIYNFKPKKKIYLDPFSKQLCGKKRKGHFKGVINVVNRFLEIIQPKFIVLGLKDFQQLELIKKHIIKRKISTKIISCKTIRERNGVPYSTRNVRLSKSQLEIASNVYKFLVKKKKDERILQLNLKKNLKFLGVNKIDYLKLLNLKTLKKPTSIKENFNIFIAYFIKNVRLIDNI